ncbi:MAG: ankyrin repeat domain-containing protein [Flavobacteriales bacterium]|nr:ankyrin repeat domain-containing protein [Flavobacteriales bacterium]
MLQIESGSIEVLKSHLENGGDPGWKCYDTRVGKSLGFWLELHNMVSSSRSYEMIVYYLKYDIPQTTKNDMLESFVATGDSELIELMVNHGCHVSIEARECLDRFVSDTFKRYTQLVKAGYDFNWQDDDGNTLLMLHSKCKSQETSVELVSILQFLITHGARTDIKNHDGKTAFDLAANPKVKDFLAQYE